MTFVPRLPGRIGLIVWSLWLAFIVWTTLGPTQIHIEYFSKLGEGVSTGLVAFLVATAAGAWIYSRVRIHRDLWQWEPAAAMAVAAAACLVYHPVAFLVVVAWSWVAFAGGRGLLARFKLPMGLSPGDAGLAAAAAATWLGVAFYLLGTAHLFNRPALFALWLLTAWIGRRELTAPVRILRSWRDRWSETLELKDTAIGLAVFYGFLFLGFGLAVALTPAINIDALREHLRFAQIALDSGTFLATPFHRNTYFPWGFEVFLAAAQAFGGQAAAELVNPVFFLGLLSVSFGILRRAGLSRSSVLLGIVVAATVPFLHRTGFIVKNDIILFVFQLGSLLAWLRARDERNDRWLWVAVLFLALSLGVKHTAAFGAIPLGLMFLWSTWRRPKLLLGLMLFGAAFGGLWHLRAYSQTGYPFFPLGTRFATKQFPSKGVFKRPPLWQVHAIYPWAVHYAGNSTYGSPSNNPTGMALPLFVIAWLLVRRRRADRTEIAILAFCAIYYVYWGYIWGIIRYFLGPLILLIALTLARARDYWDESGGWSRRLGLAALTWNFVFAVPPTMMFEINLPQLQYLAGRIDRSEFLTQAVSGYRVMRELERRRDPDDETIAFQCEHLVYAPEATKIGLMYSGSLWRARREQLTATRYFRWIIVDPVVEREFPDYPGADDYEKAYGDEAFALLKRKPGVEPVEIITDPNDIAPLTFRRR